ncbi:unnamed protein product [Leptidea sinapis]|uniref:Uncharacterized protein n=1 Tax=Leptidea sinapis TaxID=189913 RepID=A0A5E4QZ25_9NEOP|nr:unnamed protein product [Leptidea sinapis]
MAKEIKDGSALITKKKIRPRKSRDADCCSVNFLKCVLHIFNVIFLQALVYSWWEHGRSPLDTDSCRCYPHPLTPRYRTSFASLELSESHCVDLVVVDSRLRIEPVCYAGAGGLAYYYEVAVEYELGAQLNQTKSAWHEHDPRLLVPDSCCRTDFNASAMRK